MCFWNRFSGILGYDRSRLSSIQIIQIFVSISGDIYFSREKQWMDTFWVSQLHEIL